MRCYLKRDGHIRAVEELPGLTDAEAISTCHALFVARGKEFDGFEVWDRARMVVQYPAPDPEVEPKPA